MTTASKLMEKWGIAVPPLEEIKEKLRGISAQDLLRHRDLVLYGLMLTLILFGAYSLLLEPETRRLEKLRMDRQQLAHDVQALETTGIRAQTESTQRELNRLSREVAAAETQWQAYQDQGLLTSVSKGDVLKEVGLLPPGFGWAIVKMQEVETRQHPGLARHTHTLRISGEGTFRGLVQYLRKLEQTSVPLWLENLEVERPSEGSRMLRATVLLRAAGVGGVPDKPAAGEE